MFILIVLALLAGLILYQYFLTHKKWNSVYWNPNTRRFFHPWKPTLSIVTIKALWKILSAPSVKWPQKLNVEKLPVIDRSKELIITNIGHATFLIQMDNLNIITDPVFSEIAGPLGKLGPKRIAEPGISLESLPPLDVAFISHNHYDHLDKSTVLNLAKNHPNITFIVPLGIKTKLLKWGIPHPIIELDWWTSHEISQLKITAVPAQHWSRRGLFDTNKTLWMGGMFETQNGTVFFAGDTGLGPHFDNIADYFKHIDVGLLPIGSYKPYDVMKQQHMGPKDALEAHKALKTKTMIPIHYDVFQLGKEKFLEAEEELIKEAKALKIPQEEIKILKVGQKLQANPYFQK